MKKALTIAGSDSSGGAGIQADLKTFSALGVFGMSVITAVTAQNTREVSAVHDIPADVIAKQIDAIFEDIEVDALKIGMVSRTDTIKVIADKLREYKPENIVLDPVMISKSGYDLLKPEAKEALIRHLLPLATVITPNIPEGEAITGQGIKDLKAMEQAARDIYEMGPRNVLLKGGHLEGDAVDILYDGRKIHYFRAGRIDTRNTHGTGCTLSSAIAAHLARGYTVEEGIKMAKEYITTAIEHSFSIGRGVGPVHHFYMLYRKAGMMD